MATVNQKNGPLTTNSEYFPTFCEILNEHGFDERYLVGRPFNADWKKQWCLIGEITNLNTSRPARLVLGVRDRTGAPFVVSLSLDLDDKSGQARLTKLRSRFKIGYTVAAMRAMRHQFAQGTLGIRVKDQDEITLAENYQVFPCKLGEFIKLNDDADRHNWFNGKKQTCHGCGKEEENMARCSACKRVRYCSKKCQEEGWKSKGHHKQCKVLRDPDLKYLFRLDWTQTEQFFGFGHNVWKGRDITPAEEAALRVYNT